jgi:hypothetical protein
MLSISRLASPAVQLGLTLHPIADFTLQRTCRALSRVCRIKDGGVFIQAPGSSFWDCWTEDNPSKPGAGAWVLRLGRVEVVVDYGPKRKT